MALTTKQTLTALSEIAARIELCWVSDDRHDADTHLALEQVETQVRALIGRLQEGTSP